MKKQIRYGVFETNSSMSHALTIMSKADYNDLLKKDASDDWAWCSCYNKWVRKDSEDYEYGCCWDSFYDEEADYETKEFTTEHGDVVVAISRAKEDY